MNDKPFIARAATIVAAVPPIIPKSEWPAFPPCKKPHRQSPHRTVLWFGGVPLGTITRDGTEMFKGGVRIIVEGSDQAAVDAYAKLIQT